MIRNSRLKQVASSERGFTLIELLIVIVIIGVMLAASVVAFVASMGNADARGAGEMLKQDLRKVYAWASSGKKPPNIDYRYQYRITFNGHSDVPPDSYMIEEGTPDAGGVYTWLPKEPDRRNANRVSGNYILPTSNGGTQLNYGTNRTIYFVSFGAITIANTDGGANPGGDMTIKFTNGTIRTITVSGYGNISD